MDATTLLEHREFVFQVARALLRNEADAEDAVQDTYVAALQSAPPRTGRVRPWLGGIVRNVARNRRRRELRRVFREAKVARPDRASGASESSERLAWQQRVVEAVLALDPIYRDVLVLRFYEDLAPREVAARLEIPVNTVRTRTRRAIERLRSVFDSKYGGRKAWSAAMVGLVLAQSAASAGVPKLLVAATLLAVTGATGALLHWTTRADTESPTRVASGEDGSSARRRGPAGAPDSRSTENSRARSVLPTHFRGRFMEHGTQPPQPLAGAEVILGRVPQGWIVGKVPERLATTVTDEEGRFALRWDSTWRLTDAPSHLYLLHVRRNERWSDPIYATIEGLTAAEFRASVELIDNPRFEFVVGPSRMPVVGARVSLFLPPERGSIELGALLSSALTDAQGVVQSEWPSWADKAMIRVERRDGDVLQWQFTLQQARSYDPYDIVLDESELATVHLQVLEQDGSPAGPGVRVYADGIWAPDGVVKTPYLGLRVPGAEPVPLIGTTNRDGSATFRFPADRARKGLYLPRRMLAFRIRDGELDYVVWNPEGTVEDQCARTGRSLPPLRFGENSSRRPFFAVRGLDPGAQVEMYRRTGNGRVRTLSIDFETLFRASEYTLFTLIEGAPEALGDRDEISLIVRTNDGFGWARITGKEFARCLRGKTSIEPGAVRKPRVVTIRIADGAKADEVWLESVEVPFVTGDSIGGGVSATIELPDVPGKWRVLLDETIMEGVLVDPRERTEYVLDPR